LVLANSGSLCELHFADPNESYWKIARINNEVVIDLAERSLNLQKVVVDNYSLNILKIARGETTSASLKLVLEREDEFMAVFDRIASKITNLVLEITAPTVRKLDLKLLFEQILSHSSNLEFLEIKNGVHVVLESSDITVAHFTTLTKCCPHIQLVGIPKVSLQVRLQATAQLKQLRVFSC